MGGIGEDGPPGARDAFGTPLPRDPGNPATWLPPGGCDGRDRHGLSMPLPQALGCALAGAALVMVDLHWHVRGRGLGLGIGLLLVPVLTALFARWVDGPVLFYRSWGRLRRLDLRSVTAVGTGKRARTGVRLSAPGLKQPLSLELQSRLYVVAPPAREHLRGWLTAPHVAWDPVASALLDGSAAPTMRRRSRQRRVLVLAVPAVAALFGLGLAYAGRPDLAIAGAPGYRTFGGPHGKALAVGRPWGVPCRPVRFTVEEHVPDWIYAQAVAAVDEARRDGVDVTIETRRFMWTPTALYYAPGQSPETTVRVPIFVRDGTPPRLRDGTSEHINLGWDARVVDGGHHEALTDVEGDLYTQSLGGDPVTARRAIRQLIAMTQGILSTRAAGSGIANAAATDRFSAADVAAMKIMSGCGDAAGPGPAP